MPSPSGEHPWAKKIGHLKIGTDVQTLYHPAKKMRPQGAFFLETNPANLGLKIDCKIS
jgi:hypothetical protein